MDYRKALTIVTLIAFLATPARSDEPPLSAPLDWPQTFSDTFNHGLSQWTTRFPWGGRYIPGSKEEQIYVDQGYSALPVNPFSINNDTLTISANPLGPKHMVGRRYTSGVITSYPKFSQLYGYFEIGARLPKGLGLWPAFWLLPVDLTWPPEIDIEQVGDSTKLHLTVHYEARRQTGFTIDVPNTNADFHAYGMLWTPKFIAWYFDHKRVAFTATPADMHTRKMYLLISLAVGGTWPGSPTPETPFPATLEISDVHAYALPAS